MRIRFRCSIVPRRLFNANRSDEISVTLHRRLGTATPQSPRDQGPGPILDRSASALTSALTAYELGFRTDMSYRLLNGEVGRNWDYGTRPSRQGYAGVTGENGDTDLVTPYMISRYLLS